MDNNVNVKTLSDEQLAQLHQQASQELERRRPKVALEDIRPGMNKETAQAARNEIAAVLKRMGL